MAAGRDTEQGCVGLLARTIRGIEWVGAAEIAGVLGSRPTAIDHREIRFEHHDLVPELLTLGTLDDVFVVACEFGGIGHRRSSLQALGRRSAGHDLTGLLVRLRRLRQIPPRPSFDVTATFRGSRNFNRFEVEDAVGSAIAAAAGWRYETRSEGRRPPPTELSLRVHLSGEHATVAARVGHVPLHRRPYRQASRGASVRPPLARALALLVGLPRTGVLLDPFCGAGTIPIEASLAQPGPTSSGRDVDPAVLELARANAGRAGVEVDFATAQAGSLPDRSDSVDRIATNPPWGRAIHASGSLADAWRELRRVLDDSGRVVLLGPDALLDEAAATLPLALALRMPVSLLGQHVVVGVLSPDGRLTASGQLFEREIDEFAPAAPDVAPVSAVRGCRPRRSRPP